MKKLVIFSHNEWAFGSIHYGLVKELWKYGIDGYVLDWDKKYTPEEMYELDSVTDIFLTTPHGAPYLEKYINASKIIIVAHSKFDLEFLISNLDVNRIGRFLGFGVISSWLLNLCGQMNILRIPNYVPQGIIYEAFYAEPNEELKTIGYAGTARKDLEYLKRSHLIERAAKITNLEYKIAETYHNSFVTMSGFYKRVDAVICASTEEGAGLPMLEAGAAGKLVIGTKVGHWQSRIGYPGGHSVSIDEKDFIEETVELLNYYKNNKIKYQERCREIQEHAKNYSWSKVSHHWLDLIEAKND